jgi:hypothetical protein
MDYENNHNDEIPSIPAVSVVLNEYFQQEKVDEGLQLMMKYFNDEGVILPKVHYEFLPFALPEPLASLDNRLSFNLLDEYNEYLKEGEVDEGFLQMMVYFIKKGLDVQLLHNEGDDNFLPNFPTNEESEWNLAVFQAYSFLYCKAPILSPT